MTGIAEKKPLVVSSASMIMDIAQNIGGDYFRYDLIVPIGGDPHIYEPTPSDAQLCADADLILKNGLTFEGWITRLIESSGTDAPVITVSEGIEPIASTVYANATDPHAWMTASNGVIYAGNVLKSLQDLLPAKAAIFQQNHDTYVDALTALDEEITQKIQSVPENKRILITSHDAFHYYGKRYGLRLESILGTSTDADVQTADLRRLNTVIRTTAVPAVFIESTINPKMLEQLAADNGIVVGGKLYADSLGDPDSPAGTYIDMLRYNTETIYNALIKDRAASADTGEQGMNWLAILLILLPLLAIVFYFILRKKPVS